MFSQALQSCRNWLHCPGLSCPERWVRSCLSHTWKLICLSRLRSSVLRYILEWNGSAVHIFSFIGDCQIVLHNGCAISPSQPAVGESFHFPRSLPTLWNVGPLFSTWSSFAFIPCLSVFCHLSVVLVTFWIELYRYLHILYNNPLAVMSVANIYSWSLSYFSTRFFFFWWV